MRKLMIVSVVLASLAAAPVAAQAQAGSGVDQYQENIPGAGGNQPDGSNGGHNGGNAAAAATRVVAAARQAAAPAAEVPRAVATRSRPR